MVASEPPNCSRCRHLAVSWDARFPHLCRLYGFKSRAYPCVEVLRSDGRFCQGFSPKQPKVQPTGENAWLA
jgi:hypothetical protein